MRAERIQKIEQCCPAFSNDKSLSLIYIIVQTLKEYFYLENMYYEKNYKYMNLIKKTGLLNSKCNSCANCRMAKEYSKNITVPLIEKY